MALDRRELVVKEIVETERSFVSQVRTCLDLFVKQWTQSQQSLEDIGDQALVALLSELEVLAQFNGALLKELEEAWNIGGSHARMGKIFKEFAPFLKMFATYLGLYEKWSSPNAKSKNNDDDEYTRFCKACESDVRCKGLSLNAFLITPVQRVPRYRLLLEELMKYTPAEHVDFVDLEAALKLVAQAAGHNNDKMGPAKLNESSFEHLSKLQLSIFDPSGELNLLDWPARKLILGPTEMKKLCRKGPKQFTFWLFSDLLLYAQKSTTVQRAAFAYQLNRVIRLDECALADTAFATLSQRSTKRAAHLLRRSPDHVSRDRSQCFQLLSSKKSFIVEAPSIKDAAAWREAIERLRADALKRDHTALSDQDIRNNARAPIWTPDRAVTACEACNKPFTVVRRRHHCRDCGKCFCSECSSRTKVLPHLDSKKKQRVCATCFSKPATSTTLIAPPLPARENKTLAPPSQVLPPGLVARDEDDDDTDEEDDFASSETEALPDFSPERFNPYAAPPRRQPPEQPPPPQLLNAKTESPALPPRRPQPKKTQEIPSFHADASSQPNPFDPLRSAGASAETDMAAPSRPPPPPPPMDSNAAPTRRPPPPPCPPPASLLTSAPPPPPPRIEAGAHSPKAHVPHKPSSPKKTTPSAAPEPPPRRKWPPVTTGAPPASPEKITTPQAPSRLQQWPPPSIASSEPRPPKRPVSSEKTIAVPRAAPTPPPRRQWSPASSESAPVLPSRKFSPQAEPAASPAPPEPSREIPRKQWPPSAAGPKTPSQPSYVPSPPKEPPPTSLHVPARTHRQWPPATSQTPAPTPAPTKQPSPAPPTLSQPAPPKPLPPRPPILVSGSSRLVMNGSSAPPKPPVKESAAMIAAKRAATLRRQSELDLHKDDDDSDNDDDDDFSS